MISLILSAMLLMMANAASWCDYDCASYFPNHQGLHNWGTSQATLPFHRSSGFSPFTAQQLCSTPTTVSELTHPVQMFGRQLPTFGILCGEGVKVFEVDQTDFHQIAEIELTAEDPGIFLTVDFNRLVISTENRASAYEVTASGVSLLSEISSDKGASAPSHVAGSSLYGYFGTSVIIQDLNTQSVTQVDTQKSNSLSYAVIDGRGNAYFCSGSAVVQVNLSAQNSKVIELPQTCSALLANRAGFLIVSTTDSDGLTSTIYEVNTKSGDLTAFSSYDFVISGISRVAWRQAGDAKVALLGIHSNLGVHVIFERHPVHAVGSVRSFFNTTTSLTGRPTLSSLGNPIVFESEEAFAYTDSHLVRIFSTKFLEPLDHYTAYDFLSNPLFFNNQVLIGFTSDGFAVAYNRCTRFPIGSDRPENSCPFADLESEAEDAWWVQFGVGAGTFVALPFLGTTLCKKMKLLGDEEDDHVDVELYSEDDEEEEEDEGEDEERYLTPTPFNVKRQI